MREPLWSSRGRHLRKRRDDMCVVGWWGGEQRGHRQWTSLAEVQSTG